MIMSPTCGVDPSRTTDKKETARRVKRESKYCQAKALIERKERRARLVTLWVAQARRVGHPLPKGYVEPSS